jgi:hypothetical protein
MGSPGIILSTGLEVTEANRPRVPLSQAMFEPIMAAKASLAGVRACAACCAGVIFGCAWFLVVVLAVVVAAVVAAIDGPGIAYPRKEKGALERECALLLVFAAFEWHGSSVG